MSPNELLKELAATFLARAKAQRWRGPTADDRAVEFFLGVWQTLILTEHPAAHHIGMFTSMILPARGVKELKRMVSREP